MVYFSEFPQGRNQTSVQDEASFERLRREPLGGSGGKLPQKILKSSGSEMLFKDYLWHFSLEKSILGKCRSSHFYCLAILVPS